MQIKQSMLVQQLQKKIAPLYILVGQEHYLLEESLATIKSAIKKTYDCDEKILAIQSSDDWTQITEEASSYSLFSEVTLLNIFYDKKTIDAAGKKIITAYLNNKGPHCVVILRAPNVPAKQIQWLCNDNEALVVVSYPLNAETMKAWIRAQLQKNSLKFEPQIPDLIYHYTQGNMLACAQIIEKLALTHEPNSQIYSRDVSEHLSDQCVYTLFELTDACLSGKGDKAIHILRQAAEDKTEATLVLWILTQEIRLLLQLLFKTEQNIDFKTACSQLKIWPQRMALYQLSSKRTKRAILEQFLQQCRFIDAQIKSNLNTQVWNSLEKLSLSLCLGELCVL